jgi:hypothetical protein
MEYNAYHACPNDCLLFRNEYENDVVCSKCGEHRYKEDMVGKTIPRKVLRHFPIIPRLGHLFQCKTLCTLMDWHAKNRSRDNVMRIPADCEAFKHIEEKWPIFVNDPRNIKMGIALDGVNPFSIQNTQYSVWPVIVVNYNIPPYMSIKKQHMMLSLLVPGRFQVKNMDTYLQPLIEECKSLWNGVVMHDISRPIQERNFMFHGIICWTMHDYPGLGVCSSKYF